MNKYLEKVALNKLETYVVQNLEKFPLAVRQEFARRGFSRSVLQEARGVKKRDLALLKTLGGKVELDNLRSAGSVADTNTLRGRVKGIGRTHEVAELLEAQINRQLRARGQSPVNAEVDRFLALPDKSLAPQAVRDLIAKLSLKGAGSHNNLAVLGRESNVLRNSLYPEVFAKGLPQYRAASGEADLIEALTGKRYGATRLTNKDLQKLRLPPKEFVYEGDLVPLPANLSEYWKFITTRNPHELYLKQRAKGLHKKASHASATEEVPVESLSRGQLAELFALFKQLPSDSPEGQPGLHPFYGSVKLSEGTPGKRELRKADAGNYLFGKEGTSPDEYEFEYQRAMVRGQ